MSQHWKLFLKSVATWWLYVQYLCFGMLRELSDLQLLKAPLCSTAYQLCRSQTLTLLTLTPKHWVLMAKRGKQTCEKRSTSCINLCNIYSTSIPFTVITYYIFNCSFIVFIFRILIWILYIYLVNTLYSILYIYLIIITVLSFITYYFIFATVQQSFAANILNLELQQWVDNYSWLYSCSL